MTSEKSAEPTGESSTHKILDHGDLPEGRVTTVTVGHHTLAVTHHDGEYGCLEMAEPVYDVVWPKSPRGVQTQALAPRLDSLEGRRVAFLWDYLFRGDEIFPVLEAELANRFGDIEIVGYEVFGNTHGGDEKEMVAGLPAGLAARHIDAVVSGMGC